MGDKKNWLLTLALVFTGCLMIVGINPEAVGAADNFSPQVVETVPAETQLGVDDFKKTHESFEELLSAAEEKIQIGVFYMIDAESSRLSEILDTIEEKTEEGVRLEVVSDTVFYRNYPDVLDRLDELENSDVRIIDLDARTGGVMHAKYFMVDDRHFYIGSANFDWRSLEHIREVGIAGSSPEIVSRLQMIFAVDFELASRSDTAQWEEWQSLQPPPDYRHLENETISMADKSDTLMITATPPELTPTEIMTSEEAIIRMINSAQNEIFADIFQYGLESPYSPDYYDEIDRALRRAAARDVEVRLQVSSWSLTDYQQEYLKSLQQLSGIEVRYLDIPIASGGYTPYSRTSHPKLLVVDRDAAWLGSANWQPGYFDQSRNVGIITGDSQLVGDLRRFFLTAWTGPYARFIYPDKEYAPPYRE